MTGTSWPTLSHHWRRRRPALLERLKGEDAAGWPVRGGRSSSPRGEYTYVPWAQQAIERLSIDAGARVGTPVTFSGMRKLQCALILWVASLGALSASPQEKGGDKSPKAPPATTFDRIRFKDGKTVSGKLLDLTEKKAVIEVRGERKTFPLEQVVSVKRAASEKLLALFKRKADRLKTATEIKEWKGLAEFCAREKLLPERLQALRQVIRIDPQDLPARSQLGHARLGEEWLDEDAVEAKIKEGYSLVEQRLVKKDNVSATAVASKEAVSSRYKVLARTKQSSEAQKKLEKSREDRLKAAARFLANKQEEYNGIDWTKRHVIKTRNFEVHCNSTYNVARAYGELLEMIRAKLSEMFMSKHQRGGQHTPVFIYTSQQEFMSTDRLARWGGRGLGGYYRPDTQAITAFHGTFGFTGTTFSVLCHEGTHYYQGLVLKDFENIPIWLIEGLAVYFGDGSLFDPKTKKITIGQIPRDRLAHIQEKMLLKRHRPIAKLVAMSRNNPHEPFTGSEYADAWALIYFLVNSGDQGKKLLIEYWAIGLEQPLKKDHFLGLAKKYFGGLENMEKRYVDYILELDMPSAGKVLGDYFVSDTFQFDYKAPSPSWEFFEDKDDKKMLVGLFLPDSSAEIRVYYSNNDTWAEAKKYFEAYSRAASSRYKDFRHDESKDVIKSGSLEWYRVFYTDDARSAGLNWNAGLDSIEGLPFPVPEVKKDENKPGAKRKEPREVTRHLMIQVDGVVEIACSAKKGEALAFEEIFSRANESFTLCFARRW